MIHYIYVDLNNDGELYSVGIQTSVSKDVVLEHFYKTSQEVIYVRTKDEDKKLTGIERKLPFGGYIVSCKFHCDRCQSLERSKRIVLHDARYQVCGHN